MPASRTPRESASAGPEQSLARIVLVRACEESDPEGRFVPRREREAAARAAREEGGADAAAFVAARARRLADALESAHPALGTARRAALARIPALPTLAATAAAGLAADALGGERRVNLLAFPLLALLVWNLGVYVALLVAPLLARSASAGRLGVRLARAPLWLARRRLPAATPAEARWLGASLRRFGALWVAATGALAAARIRRLLHLGALGFALGVVAGMYVRGLAFEYRAAWESTFLDAPAVSRLLGAVLGPAAGLLDAARPDLRPRAAELLDAASIAALRAPSEGGPAATWIHLWALTALGAIGIPRAALAWSAGRRARRLAAGLAPDLGEPYFLRLRAPERGEGIRVEVLPYSHRASALATDALLELLHELVGNRARIEVAEPLPYGAEPPAADGGAGDPHGRVVVFNLAQPPEEEVHGVFLAALRDRHAQSPRRPWLLVLLDEEPYRIRHESASSFDRVAQRRRAWERVGRGLDLRMATLRPLAGDADAALAEARAALWPAAPGEAA